MSFSVVIEFAALVAYVTIISGGKQRRDKGWKVLCTLLAVAAVVQCAGMTIIVSSLDFLTWKSRMACNAMTIFGC